MVKLNKLDDMIHTKGVKKTWLAQCLGQSKQNFSQKLHGRVEFTLSDAVIIKGLLGMTDEQFLDIFCE